MGFKKKSLVVLLIVALTLMLGVTASALAEDGENPTRHQPHTKLIKPLLITEQ